MASHRNRWKSLVRKSDEMKKWKEIHINVQLKALETENNFQQSYNYFNFNFSLIKSC